MRCTFQCFSLLVASLKYQQSFCAFQWEILLLHICSHLKNEIQIALPGAFMVINVDCRFAPVAFHRNLLFKHQNNPADYILDYIL